MEHNLLITPAEVVALAFGCGAELLSGQISQATIVAAERKYLVPVWGAKMVERMKAGDFAELVEEWVRPALALYVKRLVLPSLAVKVGVAGVVSYLGEGFEMVGEATLARLLRRTKADADALIDKAVEVVEASPEEYPDYCATNNVRHRVNVASGVVL